jgi:CRISPR/Cas system-associated exonuclease Cas4 (RecB family)
MLDATFVFSQHSLSDLEDCPRRFYLGYMARQAWPLIESGPMGMDTLKYQAYLQRGALLHTWIERYWLGIKGEGMKGGDEELAMWWSRFVNTDFGDLPPQRLPELALIAPIGEYRLYARFDLLALPAQSPIPNPQSPFVIIDWKTLRSENPLPYRFFRDRLQTRAYLYVLATAGAPFNAGVALEPEQCVLRYWLANFSEKPWVEIAYSRAEYEQDKQRLLRLIEGVAQRSDDDLFNAPTTDEKKCTYCQYRTLCNRKGDANAPMPDEATRLIDLADIQELDY